MALTNEARVGLFYGIAAYVFWGLTPFYFKALAGVSSFEVLGHRIFWSVIFLAVFLLIRGGGWQRLTRRQVLALGASSLLVCSNWLVYIYAIAQGQTVDASLGYFINPVFTVFLGVVYFNEVLTPLRRLSLSFVVLAIAVQLIGEGRFSWISMALPVTFGLYGLVKKRLPIGSVTGLFYETLFAMPLAVLIFSNLLMRGQVQFDASLSWLSLLLVAAGFVTTIPLLCFAEGAKRLNLSSMGFLQYIVPSLQLLIALAFFGESVSMVKGASFGLVWLGLLVLTLENQGWRRLARRGAGSTPKSRAEA